MKSLQLGDMDPSRDLTIYAGGKRVQVINWAWDSVGNRYLIFLSEDITGDFLQVIHHLPDPPFMVMSNPTLANVTQGNCPTISEGR